MIEITLSSLTEFFALCGSLAGAYLVAGDTNKKRFFGYVVWVIANFLWLMTSLSKTDYIQSILWGVYIIICVRGIKNNI